MRGSKLGYLIIGMSMGAVGTLITKRVGDKRYAEGFEAGCEITCDLMEAYCKVKKEASKKEGS